MIVLKRHCFLTCFIFASAWIGAQEHHWARTFSHRPSYRYVTNDPLGARFYTLSNGLTVILSPNHANPRIAVRIAVRTGSNNDPEDHTGLAHYLEHLLFKGTKQFGSLDWQREKPMLDSIQQLYETYNHTRDSSARATVYRQIDRVSGQAAKFAIANEYDKLMADIGSQESNAHTSVEETVYEEDIPMGAMDKFLAVQSERFRDPVFRLFHTELEAVYEEKNRGLDNDASKVNEAMLAALFPAHHYGTQTTIGTLEHLKNPSLVAIRSYYNKYYVPGNIAIIMAGDFIPDSLIIKIAHAFSYMKPVSAPVYIGPTEKPILTPIEKNIYGPSAENIRVCFRTPVAGTREALVLDLIGSILSNGEAGLLDIDLNKQQKLQSSGAGLQQFKDYGVFILAGSPKNDQSLTEVKDLLFKELDKLKKGDFDAGLIKAIALNNKEDELEGLKKNDSRVGQLTDAFIKNKGDGWEANVEWVDQQAKVSQQEILEVAGKYFGTGYAIIYKHKGVDSGIVKVDKPPITPVETNVGKESRFVRRVKAMPVGNPQPSWMDFSRDFKRERIGNADLYYVQNKDNDLFRFYYRFEMGSWNDKLLPIAVGYLNFLATEKHSADEMSKAFYGIACSYNINVDVETTTMTISGLSEYADQALSFFEELLTTCKPDDQALTAFKDRLLKARANAKLDKQRIAQGLINYARYGEKNPFNNVLTVQQIQSLTGEELTGILRRFFSYRHAIIYFGPRTLAEIKNEIGRIHAIPESFADYPPALHFDFARSRHNEVLFADYDMVQDEIYWVRNGDHYDSARQVTVDLFNGYFGADMGSVVFQTIRESRALAYSTFAEYVKPGKLSDPYFAILYVGCQADKMTEAIDAMNGLLDTLPQSPGNFRLAKTSLKKDLETSRHPDEDPVFAWLAAKRLGLSTDQDKTEYEGLNHITLQDIRSFHDRELARVPYTYCIVGSGSKMDFDALKKIGTVRKLTLREIFGY
ncbi:MAG TPA: insulinase family protein [Puia sp.]|nr:insulinase family protein [Puia sp.]